MQLKGVMLTVSYHPNLMPHSQVCAIDTHELVAEPE